MGHRMSSLPIAQFCGLSPRLSEQYGAGRAAAMGRAFHASCADEPDAGALLAALTDEEAGQVCQWKRPEDVEVGGYTLKYADAIKEQVVALDVDGEPCSEDDPRVLTVGHMDFAWIHDGVAYVADIKRSEWTVAEGAKSLQLLAYGLAWAAKQDCSQFCVGIWAATEGRWQWSEMFDLFKDGDDIWERVKHAASNEAEASTGPHCGGCYARLHCKEHLLPAMDVTGGPLALLQEGSEGIQTHEEAMGALLLVKQMEDLAKLAKGHMQEWARRHGGIKDGAGKIYKPVESKGRMSWDEAKLKETLGDDLEAHRKQGKPYNTFRWVNDR